MYKAMRGHQLLKLLKLVLINKVGNNFLKFPRSLLELYEIRLEFMVPQGFRAGYLFQRLCFPCVRAVFLNKI